MTTGLGMSTSQVSSNYSHGPPKLSIRIFLSTRFIRNYMHHPIMSRSSSNNRNNNTRTRPS